MDGGWYRLTTKWRGESLSLSVVNDSLTNTRLILAPTANTTNQYWWIARTDL